MVILLQVGGQAVLGRQSAYATPWLTERHGYDPTFRVQNPCLLTVRRPRFLTDGRCAHHAVHGIFSRSVSVVVILLRT